MGINQIDIGINSFKIMCDSVPAFNTTKSMVDIISKKTPKNRNITGKSIVYVYLYTLNLRVFTIS